MADFTKDDLEDVFKRFFGSGGTGAGAGPIDLKSNEAVKAFAKSVRDGTDALKKQIPASKQFESVIRGQTQSYVDIQKELEELDKSITSLTKTTTQYEDVEQKRARDSLESARNAKAEAAAKVNARVAVQNFAVNMGTVGSTLIKGAFDYAKSLQSGASGVEAGTDAAATAARATGEAITSFGGLLGGVGQVLSLVLKRFPLLGPIVTGAGFALEVFGKKAAEISEAGLKFLGTELTKTQKSFKEITDSGAVFGGGMTELRQLAANAGLDIAQLSTVVKTSREDLSNMGVGLGEATRRIAGVSKELRSSDLGLQLRKLGYSAEEQAGLAASLSARLRASGDTRVRSDEEIARMTAQYGKDLKVLSDITGQDAKKALEKARMQAMEQDLLSEAFRKGGPEAMAKLEQQLAAIPEAMKKGYMEFVSTGGTAIADAATNVAIVQNPRILEQYQTMYRTLGDASIDASDALTETGTLTERTVQYARENADASREIGVAARLVGSSITRAATDIYNELIRESAKRAEGATNKAVEEAAKAMINMKPLDDAVARVEENAQKLRSAMGEALTTPLTTFATTLSTATTTVAAALEKLGVKTEEPKGFNEKFGEAAGGAVGGIAAGALAGGMIGSVVPVVGTAIGAAIGGALGAWGGSSLGGWLGRFFDKPNSAPKKMAVGGIVNGPTAAIIGEAGPEAVVPLPNGRSIPIEFDWKKLSAQTESAMTATSGPGINPETIMTENVRRDSENSNMMREQLAILNEIREVLSSSRDLQQQYVYNTYN